ncbi:hypothetical protein AAW51_5212 [Caldimonas brevitalea]|uniref:Uncharacterized protein n=2 Tax=Caldimonas brevitalea TaxID=413882 RepID=A0A0G3BV51_9BURK|nr:hypothetical protein AAW51_5212 [Caldimonas brevitalea]
MMLWAAVRRHAMVLCAAAVLSACGGGGGGEGAEGGGGGEGGTRDPLPTLVLNADPQGDRLDLADRNYFPMAPGDTWTYSLEGGKWRPGETATRTVAAGAEGAVVVTEAFPDETESETYRRTPEGLVSVLPLQGVLSAAAAAAVGDLLEYPQPFYPVGGARLVVRQGDWGEDLDGDGTNESYRFELSQTVVGFEPLDLPSGRLSEVAHLRTVIVFVLQPSSTEYLVETITSTQDEWWAPGIGLARAERETVDVFGENKQVDREALVLVAGTVGGEALFVPKPDGKVQKIALVHNRLVFDAQRNRYYASIPGDVAGNGNRIALIDAATGVVTYSNHVVGAEPTALALSEDGSALYVGLEGSGDVVKLRLPDLVEQWRARLPNDSSYGQLFAERIAVSPQDANVVAVSTYRLNTDPRHAGVVLIRAGALQPRMTQAHTGGNAIAFDGNGTFVYGLSTEGSGAGLRRIAVLDDGLFEEAVVPALGEAALDWWSDRVVLGKAQYSTPDLALVRQGDFEGGACRPYPAVPGRLLCIPGPYFFNSQEGKLLVVEASSFGVLSTPAYERTLPRAPLGEFVPGPAGQVALRMNQASFNGPAQSLWLFNSDLLKP